ncbi:MAG: prepilin-type N-terminal cleavage/methylation domain-containing protein [Gammaproteobacteria bacterium]|nr:prepilin-type N-terminal cleavage/methylation domain-containing protein [Gammaproteobacteria bacterium]MBU1973617.1 prepilin-type N-terminal cleavage/methylation domain-containing protein [Gammaproteobacteria bacterium]
MPSRPYGGSGFSLIEMAIVLFVLSLLIVGTLHGQELIGMTQEGKLSRDFNDLPTAINGYQDRFRALPGDDRQAAAHLGSPDLENGNGSGRIDGNWTDVGAASEASRAWLHLRLSGMIGGTTDPAAAEYTPRNVLGKPIGLQGGTDNPALSPIRDLAGNAIAGSVIFCSRGIPGKLAQTLEIKLDDGNPGTGCLLATRDTGSAYAPGAAAATAIDPDGLYIVCRGV